MASPRSLRVAIVGEPNAGKSTLLNALLGAPVSAVSRKFNTTRDRVLGVLTRGDAQVAFTDTPGFALPGAEGRGRYQRALVAEARAAVPRSDLVLLVVDLAKRMSNSSLSTMEDMARLCASSGAPLLLVANKVDLLRGAPLSEEQAAITARGGARGARDLLELKLALMEEWMEGACSRVGLLGAGGFDSAWMWLPRGAGGGPPPAAAAPGGGGEEEGWPLSRVDAEGRVWVRAPSVYSTRCGEWGAGVSGAARFPPVLSLSANSGGASGAVAALREALLLAAPPRPWAYSRDTLTDRPPVELVAEAVRGRLFEWLHDEVPYRITQETRSWREVPKEGSWEAGAGGSLVAAEEGARRERVAAAAAAAQPAWLAEWRREAGGGVAPAAPAAAAAAAAPPPPPQGTALLVHQDICVPTSGVARMLLARGGAPLQEVARNAAADLGKVLKRRVFLQLHVTVRAKETR